MTDVSPIEAIWIVLNLITLVLTVGALSDALADRRAVVLLNGKARELAADSIARREVFRLVIQCLLLIAVLPDVTVLPDWLTTVALMSVPVVLLLNTIIDTHDRRELIILVTAEAKQVNVSTLDRIEKAIAVNTEISQSASDHADSAYHEANSVNEKIASQGETLIAQGITQTADRAAAKARDRLTRKISKTGEDTNTKVTDIHDRDVHE